jgi:hypothetical protein
MRIDAAIHAGDVHKAAGDVKDAAPDAADTKM